VRVVATSDVVPGEHALAPGSRGFVLVLAMCMAVTALAVDTALPAFGDIRRSLGLSEDATSVTRLITYFLLGNAIGLLPAGLLSDRFGRKPVMWGGLLLYVVGAVGTMLAPTLGLMFAARFVWGLGSAGPRVAAMAMVRDAFVGERMARQMSFIMAVFILVPTIAPLLSAGILQFAPWQAVFAVCAGAALLLSIALIRLPETLAPDMRRSLSIAEVWSGCRTVLATPGTLAYLVSLTVLFGAFMSYLASSEVILDQVFDLGDWFPVFFSVVSIVMGAGMWLNGRIVERIGLDRLIGRVFASSAVLVTAMLVLTVATDGTPPFWAFVIAISAVLFSHQMLMPNLNAAAMRPLAAVAGTGAALLGMVPGAIGAVIGGVIDNRFDGTIMPLVLGFVLATAIGAIAWLQIQRAAPAVSD
jgi:DHA1 family bicyclomycin/chloramphenicol resistance-like MFS transporter